MQHEIVSRQEWVDAQTAFLSKEKAFTKARDALSAERRALPWVKIEKQYVFDGPAGKVTMAELFAGRSQLFVKHFMMGPGQQQHCVGCSFVVDHLEGILTISTTTTSATSPIARAPIAEIEVLRKRMGWRVPFVSSFRSSFNYDFNVSFTPEQMAAKKARYNFEETDPGVEDLSGASVFYRNEAGEIFHTYSAFGRGDEQFLGTYGFLDVMPKGRNEKAKPGRLGAPARHVWQRRRGRAERPLPPGGMRLRRPRMSKMARSMDRHGVAQTGARR